MSDIKVSIIMPVYKVEEYVGKGEKGITIIAPAPYKNEGKRICWMKSATDHGNRWKT